MAREIIVMFALSTVKLQQQQRREKGEGGAGDYSDVCSENFRAAAAAKEREGGGWRGRL